MATSGRGSGVVSYNVQTAVDTENHLIVAHEVSNVGSDRSQLANTAKAAKQAIGAETLEAVADRGYFDGEEIKMCADAGITVALPKPLTSSAKSKGRFRQGGFRVSGRGKCLSLSGRRETYIPFYERRKRAEAAPLFYQCLPELLAQKPLHDSPSAPHHALGARGCSGGGAEAARRKSARHAHAAGDRRAPVRHHEDAHGRNSLPDEDASQGRHRDGAMRLTYNLTRVLNIVGVPALLEAIKG
jgi:hypothetical protein